MAILKWLDEHVEKAILIVLMLTMTVSTCLQVFMRYVMKNSLTWSEELSRMCFIWLVYIGISYAVKLSKHIRVEAIFSVLKYKGKFIVNLISNILFLFFAVYSTYYGFIIMSMIHGTGQIAPSTGIPMSIMYLGMPVGMTLTVIRIIQKIISETKAFKLGDPLEIENP